MVHGVERLFRGQKPRSQIGRLTRELSRELPNKRQQPTPLHGAAEPQGVRRAGERGGAAPPRRRRDLPARTAVCYTPVMLPLKASVRNGRLILDEPTELPEGAVVDLVAIGGDKLDELDDDEREALHVALAEAIAQDDAGDTVDAEEVLAHLRARAS